MHVICHLIPKNYVYIVQGEIFFPKMTIIKPSATIPKSSSNDSLSKMVKSPSVESLQKMIMKKSPSIETLTKAVAEKTMSAAVQSAIPNDVAGAFASTFLVYVLKNRKMLQKRPSLFVSKKLVKNVSVSSVGVILNSDVINHGIDALSDHKVHLASEIVLNALKIAVSCL